MGTIVEWLGTVLSRAVSAPNEWLISLWDWFLGPAGPRLGGIALTLVIVGYANGARLDRRAASHKEVLAAEVLDLYNREVSEAPEDDDITVATHLRPAPIPRLAWAHWKRFKRRWLQMKHLPWRVKHHGCALLLWRGRFDFNVILTSVSATSRRAAMNQVLAHYGRRQLSAQEFELLDKPGANIVWRLKGHGYLILEPAQPRRSWSKQRRETGRDVPTPVPTEASPATPRDDPQEYRVDGDAAGEGNS